MGVVCLAALLFGNESARADEAAPAPATTPAPAVAPEVESVVKGNNEFAFDLFSRLQKESKGNLFFSPFSISSALAMTYAGARGATERQMAQVLHFPAGEEKFHPAMAKLMASLLNPGEKKPPYELSVANALWGAKGESFLKEFLDLNLRCYKAGLTTLDFAGDAEGSRKTINSWVEKETRDKIKELIKPGILDGRTRLVLTNAIYFRGDWMSQFKKDQTHDAPFTLDDGSKVSVPMMRQREKFNYGEWPNGQALEMPYAGGDLSMILLLPRAPEDMAKLAAELPARLSDWAAQVRKVEVNVALPQFKVTAEFELRDTLAAMGMPDAFSGQADFSGMDNRKDLCISNVIHKAYVDVNEQGTEAAAATAVVVRATAMRPIFFNADRPFLFLIRDNRTKSILFLGRLADPRASAE
jgi:serpin B